MRNKKEAGEKRLDEHQQGKEVNMQGCGNEAPTAHGTSKVS